MVDGTTTYAMHTVEDFTNPVLYVLHRFNESQISRVTMISWSIWQNQNVKLPDNKNEP